MLHMAEVLPPGLRRVRVMDGRVAMVPYDKSQ